MSFNISRYGIPRDEIKRLNTRWNRRINDRHDSGWECFDEFLRWCTENGYASGKILTRHNRQLPHSPENSYWVNNRRELVYRKSETGTKTKERKPRAEKPEKEPENESVVISFCKECGKKCTNNGSGCNQWKEWFVKNWNQNICIKPKPMLPPEPKGRQVFQYEHPDLMREGIIFGR